MWYTSYCHDILTYIGCFHVNDVKLYALCICQYVSVAYIQPKWCQHACHTAWVYIVYTFTGGLEWSQELHGVVKWNGAWAHWFGQNYIRSLKNPPKLHGHSQWNIRLCYLSLEVYTWCSLVPRLHVHPPSRTKLEREEGACMVFNVTWVMLQGGRVSKGNYWTWTINSYPPYIHIIYNNIMLFQSILIVDICRVFLMNIANMLSVNLKEWQFWKSIYIIISDLHVILSNARMAYASIFLL